MGEVRTIDNDEDIGLGALEQFRQFAIDCLITGAKDVRCAPHTAGCEVAAAGQFFDQPPGRVEGCARKRSKSGEEDVHGGVVGLLVVNVTQAFV
jgi:hypothetical protein